MAFELKPGQGTLHRIDDDRKVERGPDYNGDLNIDGTTYRLSGWIKTTGSGKKWMSLKAELPREKDAARPTPTKQPNNDDEVPF